MNLLRATVANPGLKLLSLLLAWGLWYVVREGLEDVVPANLRVAADAADPSVDGAGVDGVGVDGEVLHPAVFVKLKGTQREIELVTRGDQPLAAPIAPSDLAADELAREKEFRAEDLVLPLPGGRVRIVEMEPEVVRVRVRRIERREIALAPPAFPGAGEMRVQIQLRKSPDRVWVRAASEHLRSNLDLRTVVPRADLQRAVASMGDSAKVTATFQLQVDPAQAAIMQVLDPRELVCTAEIGRFDEEILTVPVAILSAPGDGEGRRITVAEANHPWVFAGPPPQVKLVLRGSRAALDLALARPPRAFLLAAEVPSDGSARSATADVPLHVADLPPGVSLDREDATVLVRSDPR